MKKASTRLLEQETQTPSPAPDLIPAESSTENLHWDWCSKRGHFSAAAVLSHRSAVSRFQLRHLSTRARFALSPYRGRNTRYTLPVGFFSTTIDAFLTSI